MHTDPFPRRSSTRRSSSRRSSSRTARAGVALTALAAAAALAVPGQAFAGGSHDYGSHGGHGHGGHGHGGHGHGGHGHGGHGHGGHGHGGHGGDPDSRKDAVARGRGGAVSSVDPDASAIGREVLEHGGNATDAAVATASALGITEPFSSGIGGGGYFVHYDADTGQVRTIDGRETAPAAMPHDAFIDPETGEPYPFTPERVTSGVSVGVPGTLATWQDALDAWGTRSLKQSMGPSIRLARKGFTVDDTFRGQVTENADRFGAFPATADLYLPDGDAPEVGSRFRNPDLADTLSMIAERGPAAFYDGDLADEIAQTVQEPPKSADTDLPIPAGSMTPDDLAGYRTIRRDPTHVAYRGLDVYGMAPSSSGGTTVGEALNILENYDLSSADAQSLHLFLESSALAFADRGKYLGDPAYVDVPVDRITSQDFADSRACEIDPDHAADKPVAPGDVADSGCAGGAAAQPQADTEGQSTTHLSVVDRWGNAVSYTLTIEQIGGSGMVVPDRGFLLNNELTDFSAEYDPDDPNRIDGGKRPRSSMSPTLVTDDDGVRLAIGSPGGSTIITTVLQIIMNNVDLGMSLPDAIAAPRASQRNTPTVTAEPAFIDAYGQSLAPYGHELEEAPYTNGEIGAATGVLVGPHGSLTAAAEPVRRGGGDAEVVCPAGHRHGHDGHAYGKPDRMAYGGHGGHGHRGCHGHR